MASTVQSPQPQIATPPAKNNWRQWLRKFRHSYVVGVIAQGLLTIWVVTTFTFFLVHLMPGNPIDIKIDQLQRTQNLDCIRTV